MNIRRSLILPIFLLCVCTVFRSAGQNEVIDSIDMTRAGKNAISDALYFDAIKARIHDDDKRAYELLQKYLAARPEVAAAWYELARIKHGDRELDKAEEYVKKAITLNPKNKWYKEEYASILADHDKYPEAAAVVAELVKTEPQDPNYPMIAAEYYTKAKMFDKAIENLDKALVLRGPDEDIMMRKMSVYLAMNDVDKAAEVVKELIAKEPRNGRYYKMLGDLYENNKQHKKAAEVYENAMKIIPDDPSVQYGIAESFLNAGDTASYKEHVRKVILNTGIDADVQLEILKTYFQTLPYDSAMNVQGLAIMRQLAAQHPDDDQVQAFYGYFLEKNNKEDSAIAVYKKALQIRPDNPDLWETLLGVYSDRKYADSLLKYSDKAMRLYPNVARFSYFKSIGYMNKKQYPQAINAINRAIEMQPDNDKRVLAFMYSLLADEYHSNKQDDQSDKAFEKALELDPNNPSTLNNYAYYLSERGKKLDEAEKMSKKSLDLNPGEATYLDTYGWIQYKKGSYLKAKDYVQKAIDLMGAKADATLYDHLGNICYQLNEKDKALEYWKKAKEMGAEDPVIDKKISEGKLYE
jgi:tetratricopeptide (TPR) repeat protein